VKNSGELRQLRPDKEIKFDSGTDVGILAQQLFPGGVEVQYDGLSHEKQLSRTEKMIAD
jgi:hypothetical protein